MQIPLCEVIGCRRAAAWVRVTNFDVRHEDFLCSCCWQSLHSHKPLESACYACSNMENSEDASDWEVDAESGFDFADEAVIVIN